MLLMWSNNSNTLSQSDVPTMIAVTKINGRSLTKIVPWLIGKKSDFKNTQAIFQLDPCQDQLMSFWEVKLLIFQSQEINVSSPASLSSYQISFNFWNQVRELHQAMLTQQKWSEINQEHLMVWLDLRRLVWRIWVTRWFSLPVVLAIMRPEWDSTVPWVPKKKRLRLMSTESSLCMKDTKFWTWRAKITSTASLLHPFHPILLGILMSKKVFCCSYLAVFRRKLRRELNLEVILTSVLLETQLLPRVNSWSTFVHSFPVQSIRQASPHQLLVWQHQFWKIQKLVTSASRLEHLCLQIMVFVASMNSTRWTSKIKPLSTRQWSNRPSLSQKLVFMLLSTLEHQSWLQLTQSTADTIEQNLSDSTSTFLHQLCPDLIFSLLSLTRRTMMKISWLPSISSKCTGF